MADNELEEKINKIRLQNEKIRQRYEEVEADKKNAAKLNALVQLVPSDDWPQRKEPPEFSAPPKVIPKPKASIKEHNERPSHYTGIQERLSKKDHKFAQGDGPPPDPKYNFLADSERETYMTDDGKTDDEKNRSRNKSARHPQRKRGGAGGGNGAGGPNKEAFFKDNRGPHAFHSKGESLPEYKAWRAERDRIDEARINRQKTAEGNWRREWDVNKTSVDKEEPLRKGDSNRKEYDRKSHHDNDYSNRSHGSRTYHGSQKNHGNQDYRRAHEPTHEYKRQFDNKQPLYPDDRSINTIDQVKGQVMSVKVNSPSIAGTGRVGPRQKSRVTYSSQSDTEGNVREFDASPRQKSFDEKSGANYSAGQKSTPKSPYSQRKKEGNSKSPYSQRKDFRHDDTSTRPKNSMKGSNPVKTELKDQRQTSTSSRPQRPPKRVQKSTTEMIQDVPMEDAIPSEYNPNKSHNKEVIVVQSVHNNNGNTEVLDDNVKEDEDFTDTTNDLNVTTNIESSCQDTCNSNFEYSNQNIEKDSDSTDEINETIKINENIANIQIEQPTTVNDKITCNEEIDSVSNDKDTKNDNLTVDENVSKNEIEVNESIIALQNVVEKNEETSACLIEYEKLTVEKTNNPNVEEVEKVEESILNKEFHSSISEDKQDSLLMHESVDNVKENEIKNDAPHIENKEEPENTLEKDEPVNLDKLEKNTITEEQKIKVSEKCDDKIEKIIEDLNIVKSDMIQDIENTLIDLADEKTDILETSQNTLLNDSGIVDSNSEFNDSKICETDLSKNLSANESGVNLDISADESNPQSKVTNSLELVESALVDITKENCEKLAEICDNHSAGEIVQAINDQVEKIDDHNEVKTPSKNSTKDSDVHVVKDDDKISEVTVQKVIQGEFPVGENFVKEESESVSAVEESSPN